MKKLLCAAVLLPILIGCSSGGGRSLDGKWNASDMKGMPPGAKVTMTFSGGKNMAINMDLGEQDQGGKKIKIAADITGEYSLTGDVVKITAKDATFKIDGLSDQEKKVMEGMMDGMKKQVIDEVNKGAGGTIKWVDDNNIELKGTDGTVKLTRA